MITIYFVKYGETYLHNLRLKDCILSNLSLDCEENSCGYCDFTIYPDHPMYNKLKERDADNPIEVYDNDILLFSGFIYELGEAFYLDGSVKCKGDMDYLNESIVRPYSTIEKGYGDTAPNLPNRYFEWLIEQHNKQVNSNKKFTIGINQVSKLDSNDYIYRENTQYPTTIDEISDKLLGNIGGYLQVRHVDGIRYIDYLSDWTETNSQILDFGVNLTDYSKTDDSSEIATFIIPLGAKMSETEYSYNDGYFVTSDKSVNKDKEYYTKSINGYHYCGLIYSFESDKTYYEFDNAKVRYFVTTDTKVNTNKTYYTLSEEGRYSECNNLTAFESGVTYYEYDDGFFKTSDTSVDSNKDYYTVNYNYSQCNDLYSFESGITYYEYNEDNDESNLSLTIDGLNDSRNITDRDYIKSGDMIYNESAVNKYGWIGTTYKNTDITLKENLVSNGISTLKQLISPIRTIEIKAVDMHLVNPDIKPIRIGEYVRVRSVPHNLDNYFLCRSIDLDLSNPENSKYTLGTTFQTLTGQQNEKIKELNVTINSKYETVNKDVANVKKVTQDTQAKVISVQEESKVKIATLEKNAEDLTESVEKSSKTATDYIKSSESNLIIGDMTSEKLNKNVLISNDSVNVRSGSTTLAKFAEDSIEFDKQVVFKADGIFLDNGDTYCNLGKNNILWSGAYYMHGSQSITFSANISRQLSGAVFVWSYYNGTSALDQDFTYFFVPKSHIENSPEDGVRMSDPYIGMMKYLYISNGGASGHANNASSGTLNGIEWNNKNYVLRYVIGV